MAEKGQDVLRNALEAKTAEAQLNIDNGDALKAVPITLNNIATRELTVLVEDLLDQDPSLPPPLYKSIGPGRRTIDVPSQLFPIIAKILRR